MAKRIALKDHITVDAVDLSNFARAVKFSSEHERIDVSGFNATGANEYLAGATEQEVTVEFFGVYGASRSPRDAVPDPPRPRRSSRSNGGPTRPPSFGDEPAARGQRPATHI